MMNVVCLTAFDRGLLYARFAEHGNSYRRMFDALQEAGAEDASGRLFALRRIEKEFDLDLAEICHRHAHRNDERTHPIERFVIDFIAEEREDQAGAQLWVMPERVRQVRELMHGKLVGDLEP
jgi:hypothetical protein